VFEDDFSAGSLDGAKWIRCYPWGTQAGCSNFGNQEQEWYLPTQVQLSGGALHLVADRGDTDGTDRFGAPATYPYRSGMIATAQRFEFTYGRVEFTARIPKGQAMWPALWLLPADYSWPPEIDVMEAVGQNTSGVALTLHGTDGTKSQQFVDGADYAGGWHTFAVDWQPGSLTWFVDGNPKMTVTRGVPSHPMYLLANLAVGGSGGGPIGPGTPEHASFDVDAVRVWQP
jgi:beta-glucanase (GH16 family)